MYIDPIRRQTFESATAKGSDNIPLNVLTLDLDNDEHKALTRKPVTRGTTTL